MQYMNHITDTKLCYNVKEIYNPTRWFQMYYVGMGTKTFTSFPLCGELKLLCYSKSTTNQGIHKLRFSNYSVANQSS